MDNKRNYVIIGSLAFTCYFITIFGSFTFDDTEAILKNKDILPSTPVSNIFLNDFWGTDIKSNASHKSYRPFTVLSYRLDYLISSGRNPLQFHLFNVIFYSLLCCLTLPLYNTILPNNYYSLLTSILFTLHPIHTEPVASIVGRADLLSSILFVISILLYNKALNHYTPFYYSLSCIVIGAAVLCKETAITAFGVCAALDFLTITSLRKKNSFKWFCYRMGGLMFFIMIIMYYRLKVMNFEGPTFASGDNPASFSNNLATKVFTFSYIYFLNFLLLLWPQWLCFDWSMGCIPLIETYCDSRLIFVVIFWLFIVLSCFKLIRKIRSEKIRNLKPTLMGLCLSIFPYLPASNIFFKVGFVVAERILLLPSLGFCLLIINGFAKIQNQYKHKQCQVFRYFCFLYIVFALRSIQRNLEWLSEEKLFSSALSVCPLNAKVHYNVGKIFADKNNSKLAKEKYKKAIELNPDYEQALNNLANLLREENHFTEAETLLRRAVKVRPNFAAAWMNLGIVLSNLNQSEEAEKCYLTAIYYRKKYPDCYYNLGNLYLDLNRHGEALKAWEMAVSFRPSHGAAWSNMLVLLDSLQRFDEVLHYGKLALANNPNKASLYFNIANTLGKLKKFQEAEAHFVKAVELEPGNALYFSNFGVLYHRWNKLDEAEKMYKRALEIDPNLKSAKINLKKLKTIKHEM